VVGPLALRKVVGVVPLAHELPFLDSVTPDLDLLEEAMATPEQAKQAEHDEYVGPMRAELLETAESSRRLLIGHDCLMSTKG
jgi:hypothetical protein